MSKTYTATCPPREGEPMGTGIKHDVFVFISVSEHRLENSRVLTDPVYQLADNSIEQRTPE